MPSSRLRMIVGTAVVALASALAVPAAADASLAPSAATAHSVSTAVSSSAVPHSPDGIYDGRLCGNSYFQVFDGTYTHEFFPEGGSYITGGTQQAWEEQVWWAGIIEVSGYHFVVDCY
jgi:hypothetical protein